ncbi:MULTISPECIES: 4-hydroxybenzoate octaprenyltransferase [Tatumella]|uniref:4-hydroxybenzoate octaprenyltransferase n=1 Tax=unclassified Tatumella TaxID=2649542 RepID=UPI001BAF2042|nr:4-hydroxybenzoate octaprenyltransferase [Tatumella sp. JGM16]MBS0877051.1 4-hydroxybenzoate octaprenyltransferase [Tatumella sp. JGM82]MBS0890681.1 4-hydroxybenzoate octaprenyltransferase [Tatumella sp. JGM94]MBS0893352.1 4-hydroxybenzoate octaprenyltransferase [Tatumella sp. JGM130]MBS0901354.1 4-hydroxybenzoate octaprenyltransferase [Tatumella sp. JGM100]MBS0912343.1 4-hydroxybenzoate octaprenyltransferase [Tatumella sp. JGM91]
MHDSVKISKFRAYMRLMRIDKPIGTLLLLWPTLWALWLAGQTLPPFSVLVVFVLGVIVMRAAGCVINDYADRNVDGHVKRTRLRPLPAGQVTENEAKGLFLTLVVVAFLLVLTMGTRTVLLSVGGLVLASAYPFMKRYTHLPQVVLGAAFGWAIPMAWMAVSGELSLACWLIFLANVCWTVAYDTFYAMVDRDDDLKIGVKSTAVLFGRHDKLIIGLLQITTLVLLAVSGQLLSLNGWYYLSLVIAAGFFIYQQRLVAGRNRDACFQAFLNNNYVGLVIFGGIVLSTLPFINLM